MEPLTVDVCDVTIGGQSFSAGRVVVNEHGNALFSSTTPRVRVRMQRAEWYENGGVITVSNDEQVWTARRVPQRSPNTPRYADTY